MFIQTRIAANILYQRTNLLRLYKMPIIRRFAPYRLCVELEAMLFSNRIIRQYQRHIYKEFKQISSHLPSKAVNVLDIGCGVGGINQFLYKEYRLDGPIKLFLADKDKFKKGIYYGFCSKGAAYNSLALSLQFLCEHGIPKENIITINLYNSPLPASVKFDVILSLLSWGFHYPIDTYLEYMKEHLATSGAAVLDCRRDTDGLETLRQNFAVVRIDEQPRYIRVKCQQK